MLQIVCLGLSSYLVLVFETPIHVMSKSQEVSDVKDLDPDLKAVEDCTRGLAEKVKTPAENARTGNLSIHILF